MKERQVITAVVEDKPGVLTRISSLFSRRGFNIESLTVGHTHIPGLSRFTIVVEGDEHKLEQIRKQTQKLIHTINVSRVDPNQSITREFTVIKLAYDQNSSPIVNRVLDFYGGRMLDQSDESIILEFSGSEEKIDRIFFDLNEIKIIESIRTGKVAMRTGKK